MKKKLLLVILGCFVAATMETALADPPHEQNNHQEKHREHYNIQDRIDDQERAIFQGVKNKTLTKKEARTLKYNIAKIKTDYQRAKNNDEHVSYKERERLDNMLDRNERMIRKMGENGVQRL
jgi:hypothetical protein